MSHIIERTVDMQGNVLREEVIKEQSPWMTIQEAANFLRKTEHTIHQYAREGILKKYRVGDFHTILLKRADVEALVQPVTEDRAGDDDQSIEQEGPLGAYPSNRVPAKGKSRRTGFVTTASRVTDPDPFEPPED